MLLSATWTVWSADTHTYSWSMRCPELVYCLNRYERISLLRRSLAHSTAACAPYTMCRANAASAAKRAEASCAWRTRVLGARSERAPRTAIRFRASVSSEATRVKPTASTALGHLSGECGPCACLSGLKPDSSGRMPSSKEFKHCGCCEGYITLGLSLRIFSVQKLHRAAGEASSYDKREVWPFFEHRTAVWSGSPAFTRLRGHV